MIKDKLNLRLILVTCWFLLVDIDQVIQSNHSSFVVLRSIGVNY
jgi:hypothetical protein